MKKYLNFMGMLMGLLLFIILNACKGAAGKTDEAALIKAITDSIKTDDSLKRANAVADAEKKQTAVVLQQAQAQPVESEKKKGMDPKLKGALIGAGTGAAAGAIVSRKKGKGAVIGGLIGAGIGTVVGAQYEKK